MNRTSYPTDVSNDEWAFVAPYLTWMKESAPQRDYDLREVFNALRWIIRAGAPWRMMPHDLPPWETVYQQAQRWIKWGCFEAMVHDLRVLLREARGKKAQPTAVILDGRTIPSSVESGVRAGFDGNKRRKGSKVHIAVDTLGHLLFLVVTPANEQERAQVAELCQLLQEVTGQNVKSDRSECERCVCGPGVHGGFCQGRRPRAMVYRSVHTAASVRCLSSAEERATQNKRPLRQKAEAFPALYHSARVSPV